MSGTCGDVERITEICKRHNVLMIEDTAQANGASFHGKPLGSFGDMAILSFQYNKNATSLEGGLVVSDRDELGNRAWAYHDMGYSRNEKGRVDPNGPVQTWGQGAHMSEVSATMLLAQVRKLELIIGIIRRHNQQLYSDLREILGSRHVESSTQRETVGRLYS
jgi:dTDP-4-amino-4,6-dideoxygalactose transaminase